MPNSPKYQQSPLNKHNDKELIHSEGIPTHAVIWLHGLGASCDDFPPAVPHLGLTSTPTIRFVFPQAPDRPITINNGMVMPGWYDIKGSDLSDREDLAGMIASKATLDSLIDQQIALGIDSKHILIAGFSQGGAVAYYTAIRSQHPLAGVLAMSTYAPFGSHTQQEASGINNDIPILAMHGIHDPVVPIDMGKNSAELFSTLGCEVQWKTYAMDHSVSMPQIEDIGRWINTLFARSTQ